jgi:hypothetical protein
MIVNKGDFIESIPKKELMSVSFRCEIPPIEDIYRGYGDETLWVYLSEEDREKYNDKKYTGTIMGILLDQPINYIGLLKWGDEVRLKCLGGNALPLLDPDWVVEEGLVEAPKKYEDSELEEEEDDAPIYMSDVLFNIHADGSDMSENTILQVILNEVQKYSDDIAKLAKFKADNHCSSIETVDKDMGKSLAKVKRNIVAGVLDKLYTIYNKPFNDEADQCCYYFYIHMESAINDMINAVVTIYDFEKGSNK